jgi:uncharacterized protein (TIGR03437 family)
MLFFPLLLALCCGERAAPRYSAATVVHAVTGAPALSPDTFASIYGEELAFVTRQLLPSDLEGGMLPTVLPGSGVRVWVDGMAAPVWYVSPTQINFLVPSLLVAGREVEVWVTVEGRLGPYVRVPLVEPAPALFAYDRDTALLIDLGGQVRTRQNPVQGGEDIILLATGLGKSTPDTPFRALASGAAPLARRFEFRVLLDGVAVDDRLVRYVGTAPGLAGVQQINLKLPEGVGAMPVIRLGVGNVLSPPIGLPVR